MYRREKWYVVIDKQIWDFVWGVSCRYPSWRLLTVHSAHHSLFLAVRTECKWSWFKNLVNWSTKTRWNGSKTKFILVVLWSELDFSSTGRKSPKNTIPLPVTFQPKGPGHYPCRIILKSAHDIRVYQVECTVTPEGSALELEFTSPAHQSLSQDIPVVCVCLYREVFKLLSKGDTRFGFLSLVRILCQFSTNEKQSQYLLHLVRATFPALWACYM